MATYNIEILEDDWLRKAPAMASRDPEVQKIEINHLTHCSNCLTQSMAIGMMKCLRPGAAGDDQNVMYAICVGMAHSWWVNSSQRDKAVFANELREALTQI